MESCSILLFFCVSKSREGWGKMEGKRRQTLLYTTPPRRNNHPLGNIYSLSLCTLVLSRDHGGGLAPPSSNLSAL